MDPRNLIAVLQEGDPLHDAHEEQQNGREGAGRLLQDFVQTFCPFLRDSGAMRPALS